MKVPVFVSSQWNDSGRTRRWFVSMGLAGHSLEPQLRLSSCVCVCVCPCMGRIREVYAGVYILRGCGVSKDPWQLVDYSEVVH